MSDDNEVTEDENVPEEEDFESDDGTADLADIADVDEDEVDLEGPDEEVFEEDDDESFPTGDDADADTDDDDEEEESEATARARKRKGEEDEDDDDEMLAPDDVEADLDRILKDRMVASDEEEDDEEDEETVGKGKVTGEAADGLQPKRPDEMLCTNCFLLVRSSAPGCPVEDDSCPIFA